MGFLPSVTPAEYRGGTRSISGSTMESKRRSTSRNGWRVRSSSSSRTPGTSSASSWMGEPCRGRTVRTSRLRHSTIRPINERLTRRSGGPAAPAAERLLVSRTARRADG